MNRPNKLECLCLASLYARAKCNTLAYWAHSWVMNKMKCCEYDSGFLIYPNIMGCIHNTFFSSKLMNMPNKLECLCLTSLSVLVKCNTLAYWAHSCVREKMKCCEYNSWFLIYPNHQKSIYFMFLVQIQSKMDKTQKKVLTHLGGVSKNFSQISYDHFLSRGVLSWEWSGLFMIDFFR